jgi:hypothetical protein
MPAADVPLPITDLSIPRDIRAFLREAQKRIDRFQEEHLIPAFVAGDYQRGYLALRALAESDLAPGNLFCEWGSGFGVMTCLAALLDFDAWGIEVEAELVDAARELADDFELPVEFVHGSFLPPGSQALVGDEDEFGWLDTGADAGHDPQGLDPEDFDVIFAYPWPDEEDLTARLFDRYARAGALLLTYHGADNLRLRRKLPRRSSRTR